MNLVALDRRIEPDGIDALAVELADFAGDRFSDAIVDGSMWWWYDAGKTDSLLLLLPDDEFGTGVGGSSINDFLGGNEEKNTSKLILRGLRGIDSLVLIVFEDILQLFDVSNRLNVFLCLWYGLYVRIIGTLIIRNDAKNIIHLGASLLRFQATGVRMRAIDVHQIGQIQSQIRNAWQFQTFQIVAQILPVIVVIEDGYEPIECGTIFFAEIRPRFAQPVNTCRLHGRTNSEQWMQIVEFVKLLRHLQRIQKR